MFDSYSFINDFYLALNKEADRISSIHLEKLRGKKLNGASTGFEEAYRKVIGRVASENAFCILFGTPSIKAFITEYGSGSLMVNSSENPFLSGYLGRTGYNPTRTTSLAGGNRVLSWGRGQYKTFDWNSTSGIKYITRDGGNRSAGRDIEDFGRYRKGGYTPRKPNFLLRNTLKFCLKELLEITGNLFIVMINDDKYYSGDTKRLFSIDVTWG